MLIVSKMLAQAVEQIERDRLREAEILCDEVLSLEPGNDDAWYLKGAIALSDGRGLDAKYALQKSVDFQPESDRNIGALAKVFLAQGETAEATALYERLLSASPDRADWWSALSGLKYDLRDFANAEVAANKAVSLDKNLAEPLLNLALMRLDKLDYEGAAATCGQALGIDPAFAHAHFLLGNIYLSQGHQDAAASCYRKVLDLDPVNGDALINLGNIHRERLEIAAAGEFYEAAAKVAPENAMIHSNLGIVLKDQGKMEAAIWAFDRAIELDPSMHLARSNYLFCLCFKVDENPEDVFSEHLKFEALHAQPLVSEIRKHINIADPERRLRVGLMSPDLRIHPGGHFYLPIVEGLDREHFDVTCYYNYILKDTWTSKFEKSSDHFHHVYNWSDERIVEQIRSDGIDILIEGAGHMSGNRLLVAARKPAPVQIGTALYPNTTGLSAIDYRLLDSQVALPSVEAFHSEEIIRLPETHFCYRPLEGDVSPAAQPPALANGYVTFGSFNNAIKLNDLTVSVWARILQEVPNSRLELKWLEFDRPESVGILDRFAAHGVDPSRIDRFGRSPDPYTPYLNLDVCLDPIYTSGGTTTCDALWMGVPVVTISGETQFSRTGLMHLTNIGLPELIAKNVDEFVDIAVDLASNIIRLDDIRSGLRERMKASPIMDEQRYNRFLEAELRRVWRIWCDGKVMPTADFPR